MIERQRHLQDVDQQVVLHGVTWAQYEVVRDRLDDIPGLRMAYLDGALEIISPSSRHEILKKTIARLLEVYALERNLELVGGGSTTFRRAALERALEPDECYCLGEFQDPPDIAIEAVLTGGGLDKLVIYQGLGVPEVWLWLDDRFKVRRLGPCGYVEAARSLILPDIDLEELATFVRMPSQPAAIRADRDRLRERP